MALAGLLILLAIGLGVIAMFRRLSSSGPAASRDPADLIPYGLMTLAVGAAGFALARLGRAAFPGDSVVFGGRQEVANALATLVVAVPVSLYLWRRQAVRRLTQPAPAGWTLYLTAINAMFVIAAVVASVQLLEWLLGGNTMPAWTDVPIYWGIVALHEMATRSSPPGSEAADFPRVVGSAAGLFPLVAGSGGLLWWLLDRLYATFAATAGGGELRLFAALALVGAPVWAYFWLRPWRAEAGLPRDAWTVLVSVAALMAAVGAAVVISVATLTYLLAGTEPAGLHFADLPTELTVLIMGALVWWHHRGRLGTTRTNGLRAYQYLAAVLGLGASVAFATALAIASLDGDNLVGTASETVIGLTVSLVASLAVWWWFWSRADSAPREEEAGTGPRRIYLLGGGIAFGLVAAGALIGLLLVLFQRLLGTPPSGDSQVIQGVLFVFAGLATWHLLHTYYADRRLVEDEEVVTPFEVTIICSHPGMIASMFGPQARLKVVYRDDGAGVIDDETATQIVEAVGHTSSLVWVDSDGYRVAPAR